MSLFLLPETILWPGLAIAHLAPYTVGPRENKSAAHLFRAASIVKRGAEFEDTPKHNIDWANDKIDSFYKKQIHTESHNDEAQIVEPLTRDQVVEWLDKVNREGVAHGTCKAVGDLLSIVDKLLEVVPTPSSGKSR